ncbi:MAG: hypothetical protein JW940_30590 [Polyangiaceae bacterium]|nr:hypothetical protein [Polyangiaceae bacterium]
MAAKPAPLVEYLHDTPHNQKPVSWLRLRAFAAELDGFAPFEAVELCGESRRQGTRLGSASATGARIAGTGASYYR